MIIHMAQEVNSLGGGPHFILVVFLWRKGRKTPLSRVSLTQHNSTQHIVTIILTSFLSFLNYTSSLRNDRY